MGMILSLENGELRAGSRVLLAEVPNALTREPGAPATGAFLCARAERSGSRHRFRLGTVPRLRRYTLCHRYEPYWMRPRAGRRLRDVPPETQYLLTELEGGGYLLLVPLAHELFRFSLHGRKDDTLELLAETGDPKAAGLGGLALYVACGDDPFAMAEQGARAVMTRLGGGRLRREKRLPDFVDLFGWCTWDAFYQEVSAEKLRAGLVEFARGGVTPRFLILDDGWQSTARTATGEARLTAFSANEKFPGGLASSVRMAKVEFGVERFLVWHTITGHWGGVDGDRLPGYGVSDQMRHFGEGVLHHTPSFNEDWWGSLVGFVPAADISRFYDDYHRALRADGVDGVKVDSQALLEAVAHGQGGRVPLTRAYRDALESSVTTHFEGRLINCMSNAQETWYGSPRSTLLRSSIDFFPSMPETHGAHLYTNAQVGLWFGEFMQPDWDMFQSGHEWGAFHAAGRAVSGGPVYVSDKPGQHDFPLLRELVTSDGRVLRCERPGVPTLDTLFTDPTRDDVLLKIWNRCGLAGVVGVFNARWEGEGTTHPIAGFVSPADVRGLVGRRFACYAHRARTLEVLAPEQQRPITLDIREFELFTFAPIADGFAPIGLADKLNSAGALEKVTWSDERTVELTLRDGGELVAYSEREPVGAKQGSATIPFSYDPGTCALRVAATGASAQRVTLRFSTSDDSERRR